MTKVFNNSHFGRNCHRWIPQSCFFVADAGYKLMEHIMTPFKIETDMEQSESGYNYAHSRTRIVIERSIGLLKCKFKRFATTLSGSIENSQKIIIACLILHNIFILRNEPI